MARTHDHGDRWDAGDVDALRSLVAEGRLSLAKIAEALGRTRAAIASKLYRLRRAGD